MDGAGAFVVMLVVIMLGGLLALFVFFEVLGWTPSAGPSGAGSAH